MPGHRRMWTRTSCSGASPGLARRSHRRGRDRRRRRARIPGNCGSRSQKSRDRPGSLLPEPGEIAASTGAPTSADALAPADARRETTSATLWAAGAGCAAAIDKRGSSSAYLLSLRQRRRSASDGHQRECAPAGPDAAASAWGPPPETPSTRNSPSPRESAMSPRSFGQSLRVRPGWAGEKPTPGRSGAMIRAPRSQASACSSPACKREAGQPWQKMTGTPVRNAIFGKGDFAPAREVGDLRRGHGPHAEAGGRRKVDPTISGTRLRNTICSASAREV